MENPFLNTIDGSSEKASNIYEINQDDADSLIPKNLKEWARNNNLEIPTATIYDDKKRGSYTITISSGDLELIKVDLSKSNENQDLYVGDYLDNKKIRGQQINFAFYNQLAIFAKKKGFRIICGQNHMDNISYFVEKLGRFPVYALNDAALEEIPGARLAIDNIGFLDFVDTYYFLYDEDKKRYVKDYYLKNDEWKEYVKHNVFPQYDPINRRASY